MKKYIKLALVLLLVQLSLCCSPSSASSKSNDPPTVAIDCAYSQVYNSVSETCSCEPGFYGADCGQFNCSSGVADYVDTCPTISDCSLDIYRLFCPRTCFNCTCDLECAFGQVLDQKHCTCTCNKGFYGPTCSEFNCSSGVSDFLTECPVISDCSVDIYNLFCPQTCFNCSSKCLLTQSDCAYDQEFNSTTCKCECNKGFYGDTCSEFNCSSGVVDSIADHYCSLMDGDCSQDIYRLLCPHTCFNCKEEFQCNLTCSFGQMLDKESCSCKCETGFYGPTCGEFNCSSSVVDYLPDFQVQDCVSDIYFLFCPRTCFQCSAQQCNETALNCAYGQSHDQQQCACVCNKGFSGSTCSDFDCSSGVVDSITDCDLVADCTQDIYRLFCPQTCFKCSSN